MKKRGKLVMTFGTFDMFHPGHVYYLSEARKLGDELITIIARDVTVSKIKGRLPREKENVRLEKVWNSGIPTYVFLGSEESPYEAIYKHKPDILCFGYDQRSFNDERLEKFLKENSIQPKIIIISPFEPEKWKSSKL